MNILDNSVIPYECSGTGCQYIYGKKYDNIKENQEVFENGGWNATK